MRSSLAKVAAVLLAAGLISAGCRDAKSAPGDFSLKDLNGNTVTLSSFRGHPVLLDFWATWCGPCRMSTPLIEEFYMKHKAAGLQVIGVDMDDDPSGVYAFAKEFKIAYPVVLGGPSSVGRDFSVEGLPTFILIDPDGKVVRRFDGFSEEIPNILESELSKMHLKS